MPTLLTDLRHAVRALSRNPGLSAAIILTLALGLGAVVAIFSVVDAVLLTPLPMPEPERMVQVEATVKREIVESRGLSHPDYVDLREASRELFEALVAVADTTLTLSSRSADSASNAERIESEMVSAGYFELLGASPVFGRAHSAAEEEVTDTHAVAVIGHDLWQRRFGARPEAVGSRVDVNGREFTVIGVAPPGFAGFDGDTELWIPMAMVSATGRGWLLEMRQARWFGALGRLREGRTLEEAQSALGIVAARLEAQYPASNTNYGVRVRPLREVMLGGLQAPLLVLFGAVGLVLLIACANVANLLLARALTRRRELALRAALGAGRAQLLWLSVVECLLLALLGGAGGLLVAGWGLELLLALAPVELPSFAAAAVDARALAVAWGLALLCGLGLGAVTAARSGGRRPVEALRQGERGAESQDGGLRQLLVVAEVGLALALLIGAALLVQSYGRLSRVDPGYETGTVLSGLVSLPAAQYEHDALRAFTRRLREGAAALPGVSTAAVTSSLPLGDSSSASFLTFEGSPPAASGAAEAENRIRVYRHHVSADYFATLGIPLLRGSGFSPRLASYAPAGGEEPALDTAAGDTAAGDTAAGDTAVGGPNEVVVSAEFARRIWGDGDPIGRRVSFDRPGSEDMEWLTVVGVAGNARHRALRDDPVENPDDPDVYIPLSRFPSRNLGLMVRTAGTADPTLLIGPLRALVADLDPGIPLFDIRTLGERFADATAESRTVAWLMGLFGAVALLLAALGVYAVVAYAVRRRRREIGVRMALGAQRGNVLRWVFGQALRLTAMGVATGALAAALLTRLLDSLLYGVGAGDPATFAATSLALLAVGGLAAWLPAQRATRVDPMVVLREE